MPPRITTVCPKCNAKLAIGSENAGKRLRCPKCGAVVQVPTETIVPTEPSIEFGVLPTPETKLNTFQSVEFNSKDMTKKRGGGFTSGLKNAFPGIAFWAGLLGCFVFANMNLYATGLLCYPCIVLVCIGGHKLIRSNIWKTWPPAATILVTILLLLAWGAIDTATDRWTKDATEIEDTYTRWTHRHIYRRVWEYESAEKLGSFDALQLTADGPMAGTGRLHGEWTFLYWKPEIRSQTQFYWYGDVVSEGEWHLRNSK